MLGFDPFDPFPLLPAGTLSYADAQTHSSFVDAWLGLDTERVEDEVLDKMLLGDTLQSTRPQQLWVGLPVKSLLTPYTEIRELLARLDPWPGSTIVDLGAGYGRIGFVVGRHYPDVNFLGLEFVEERVRESQRVLATQHFPLVQIKRADLTSPSFQLPSAEIYFIYDYGTRDAIEKSLEDLREIAQVQPVTIVGRGRAVRDAIERKHPWLSQVVPPEHTEHYSIYRSSQSLRS